VTRRITANERGHTRKRRKERHRANHPGFSPSSHVTVNQRNHKTTPEKTTSVSTATRIMREIISIIGGINLGSEGVEDLEGLDGIGITWISGVVHEGWYMRIWYNEDMLSTPPHKSPHIR
jgi:hypothetical protein